MKKTKYALLSSVLALVLCVSMLIGSTFAWFTDSVSTGSNVIKAGNLDVEVEYSTDLTNWKSVEGATDIFNSNALWEPGHTEVAYLRVSNEGDLALKYQLGINVLAETGSTNTLGERFLLSDYIEFGVINDVSAAFADREAARKAVTTSTKVKEGYSQDGSLEAGEEKDIVALVVFMPEYVGNEANTASNEVAPKIQLGVDVVATQDMKELDSFDNTYDADATFPGEPIHYSIGESVKSKISENNTLTEEVTIGDTQGDIYAVAPQDLKLAKDAGVLQLSVNTMEESNANVTLADGETSTSLDIHVEGVAEDNTVPMLITLEKFFPKYMNTTSVAMYHVEDGNTVAMTLTSNPTAHNEFSYDPATGTVVLCVASFSEYTAVVDNKNLWKGSFDYSWYIDESSPYTINTADQLAGFGRIVDGTADGIAADDFDDKIVNLGADIDLSGGVSLNPIGCGYVNGVANSNGVEGRAFKGTFDGQNHTISNLYQNGWDLGLSYCTLGGGLFASVADATIKNLTMTGARITMECVEMGVVAGLSQGNCTYENIKIYDSKVANYQRATGGLIGEVSAFNGGTTTIKDVTIGSDVVVGTLWGDFDAPVGGVIGARWDDKNVTTVTMENVDVAARLDVYNDITSTYQWHAYRRAGMLIGNTDTPPANGKTSADATAPFLICKHNAAGENTVTVRYGGWVDYHYCEFSEEYNSPSWPYVRVEAGENCSAYSNPRWGVATDSAENPITTLEHEHSGDDEHYVEKTFNQVYGGGQGIYGVDNHYNINEDNNPDVNIVEYLYSVTYINNGKVLDIQYVTEDDLEEDGTFTIKNEEAAAKAVADMVEKYAFSHWMNIVSNKIDTIEAGNEENIILYPSFVGVHTAIFVDQAGNIIDWTLFKEGTSSLTTPTNVPTIEDCTFNDEWMILTYNEDGTLASSKEYNATNMRAVKTDITLYPIYTYNGDVNLIPIDSDGDGVTNYYQVGGYSNPNGQALVEIPASVNGIPVTEINASAFASYDGVHSIVIPENVTYIGNNSFAEKWGFLDNGETVTIYYAGSYDDWNAKEPDFGSNWESGVSGSSRIFFLNGTGKVDPNQGYLQASLGGSGSNKTIKWTLSKINADLIDEYTGHCDCSISTTGDTAHVYVDANGNVMGRNDAGTPVNSAGTEIYFEDGGWFGSDKLTDGTNTYYRYRPDKTYWEGVTIN